MLRYLSAAGAVYALLMLAIMVLGYVRASAFLRATAQRVISPSRGIVGRIVRHEDRVEIAFTTSLNVDDRDATEREIAAALKAIQPTLDAGDTKRITISALSSRVSTAWHGWHPTVVVKERTVFVDLPLVEREKSPASVVTYWHFPRPSWMSRLDQE
jgi:hypothetical protein